MKAAPPTSRYSTGGIEKSDLALRIEKRKRSGKRKRKKEEHLANEIYKK